VMHEQLGTTFLIISFRGNLRMKNGENFFKKEEGRKGSTLLLL
jgi:hypothetical protein